MSIVIDRHQGPHTPHAATVSAEGVRCVEAPSGVGPASYGMSDPIRREVRGMSGMKRWLALGVSALAAFWLVPTHASASTLTDCLAQQHVCVASDGRSLISQSQEADLERQIGGDPIYLVVAASSSSGYNSAMNQIISALSGHPEFTVGFLDSQRKHFGAYNKGMLPSGGA